MSDVYGRNLSVRQMIAMVMVTLMMVVLMVMMILTTTQPDQRALPGVPLDHCRRHRLLHHDADGDDLEIYGRGAQHYHLFD